MWNGRGAEAERGGRISRIWILALPGSIWKNSVPWKHECSIFGMTNRRSSHDNFTLPAQFHRLAVGWMRAWTTSSMKSHSLIHDLFAMVLILHLLLPLLPPQWLPPEGLLQGHSQRSSQAAFWGEDTGKHLFIVQKPAPPRFIYNGAGTLITKSHSVFSLSDRITLPTMKVSFLKDHEFTTLRNLCSLIQEEPQPPIVTPLI